MNWLKVLNVANQGDDKPRKATLRLVGVIGSLDWYEEHDNTAGHFIRTVDALGELDEINLEINSPGGVVTAGVAIANYLIRHPATVAAWVIGSADSIASVVAQAADPGRLHMAMGTTMFVHDPLTGLVGDADDFRWAADRLDKVRDSIVDLYARRAKMSKDEIKDLLRADYTLTAEEAVEKGLADSTDEHLQAVACSADREQVFSQVRARLRNMSRGKPGHGDLTMQIMAAMERDKAGAFAGIAAALGLPADVVARDWAAAAPADPTAVITACADAGASALAAPWVAAKLPMAEIEARLAHIQAIQDRCSAAHVDADPFIAAADDPAQLLGLALTERLARGDIPIDNRLPENSGHETQTINRADIYARRQHQSQQR